MIRCRILYILTLAISLCSCATRGTRADGGTDEVIRSMDSLLRPAANDSAALSNIAETMERYLDDPNSPMRNETQFIIFLETLLRQPALGEADRMRATYKLEIAKKNRPGSRATDFGYTDRSGVRHTLCSTPGQCLLLIFYDPECVHCSEILEQVRASAVINDCIRRKKLSVLAVYTEGNRPLWDDTKSAMPIEWAVGFDEDKIVEHELYSIPAMPVMYLLDSDKTVILKDAFLPEIEEKLHVLS